MDTYELNSVAIATGTTSPETTTSLHGVFLIDSRWILYLMALRTGFCDQVSISERISREFKALLEA